MLLWAAAARFLTRRRTLDLAALAHGEYAGLNLKLSLGRSGDALQLFGEAAEGWLPGLIPTAI